MFVKKLKYYCYGNFGVSDGALRVYDKTLSRYMSCPILKCYFSSEPLFKDVSYGNTYALYNGHTSTDLRSYFGSLSV